MWSLWRNSKTKSPLFLNSNGKKKERLFLFLQASCIISKNIQKQKEFPKISFPPNARIAIQIH